MVAEQPWRRPSLQEQMLIADIILDEFKRRERNDPDFMPAVVVRVALQLGLDEARDRPWIRLCDSGNHVRGPSTRESRLRQDL